jgi:hypothetical protein
MVAPVGASAQLAQPLRVTKSRKAERRIEPRYHKERPQRVLRVEAVLFLGAAGRLWHPLLRDHIPLPCAVQFRSLSSFENSVVRKENGPSWRGRELGPSFPGRQAAECVRLAQ